MPSPRSIVAKRMFLTAALAWAAQAQAVPGYYTDGIPSRGVTSCTTCHAAAPTTCNGCHAHGTHGTSAKSTINLTATTNKTTYAPGETVTVTVAGGYQSGWVRVNLYDQDMVQLARSSCNGLTGCTTSVLPATLTAPAPTTPGTYTWRAAWYGNAADATTGFTSPACGTPVTPPCFRAAASNAGHGEEIVAVPQFTVAAPSTGPAIAVTPTALTFGDVTLGSAGTQTFTISNTGGATLTGNVAVASGTSSEFAPSPAAFSIAAGGQPVTVTVTYSPTATGADTGALSITSNDAASPTTSVTVSGTGVAQPAGGGGGGGGGDDCSSGGSGTWIAVVGLALLAARRMTRGRGRAAR